MLKTKIQHPTEGRQSDHWRRAERVTKASRTSPSCRDALAEHRRSGAKYPPPNPPPCAPGWLPNSLQLPLAVPLCFLVLAPDLRPSFLLDPGLLGSQNTFLWLCCLVRPHAVSPIPTFVPLNWFCILNNPPLWLFLHRPLAEKVRKLENQKFTYQSVLEKHKRSVPAIVRLEPPPAGAFLQVSIMLV